MDNTYSDGSYTKYIYEKDKKRLVNFKYIFIAIFSLFIASVFTCWLYKFINTDNTRIITYDMLLAVKNYNFDLKVMYKRTIIHRLIQLIGLFILSLSKWKGRLKWVLLIVISVKLGFILTIFMIEMHIYGFLNFLIILFPHEIFYICAIMSLLREISKYKYVIHKDIKDFAINRTKTVAYMKTMSLWICGVLSEITINLVLVQKCLIIPRFYK